MMSGDQFGAGYRLVNNEIIQAAVMDKFSLADWRYLFWLSQRAAAGAAVGELLDGVWDNAPTIDGSSESGPDQGASQDMNRLSSPVYRMALDIIGRAIALRRPPANDGKGDFMSISEAATLRGVSRQAINHLIATTASNSFAMGVLF